MTDFINKITTNFSRESILGRFAQPWAYCSKVRGEHMRAFTLSKNAVIQSGIEVACLPDLSGNPVWSIELGNKHKWGLYTTVPVPADGIVDTSGPDTNAARFTYLCNNIAHYVVKIVDQSAKGGLYHADFSQAMKPIAIGHIGSRDQTASGSGFEYVVPMVPGDRVKFSVISPGERVPRYYVLEATHVGIQVRFDVDRKGNLLDNQNHDSIFSNGSPISQT